MEQDVLITEYLNRLGSEVQNLTLQRINLMSQLAVMSAENEKLKNELAEFKNEKAPR